MYRLLATTVLAGAGLLLARPALAQVTFTSTAGTLKQPQPLSQILETETPATITVTIDPGNTGTVTAVTQPLRVVAPRTAPADTSRITTVNFSNGQSSSIINAGSGEVLTGSRALPAGSTVLNVSMDVESSGPLPAGNYKYDVSITVTTTPD